MNDKCKYCDYVSKCSRICEYDSYLCKVHRSFPKVVDKSYEQLQQENQQLQKELECTIGIVEHNRIISEKNKEINQLKDNWNKLKEYMIKEQTRIVIENTDEDEFIYTDLLNKMQELE